MQRLEIFDAPKLTETQRSKSTAYDRVKDHTLEAEISNMRWKWKN